MHRSYVRTVAYRKENDVQILSFLPAYEDILFYDKRKNVLGVKARLPKNRDQYLTCFAPCIIRDESILLSADRDKIYSLEPVQKGRFNRPEVAGFKVTDDSIFRDGVIGEPLLDTFAYLAKKFFSIRSAMFLASSPLPLGVQWPNSTAKLSIKYSA